MYHTQVSWPSQSSAVQPQLIPEGAGVNPMVPKMDIFETREEVVYLFEMPGVNAEQLDVEIEGRSISISAPVPGINPNLCSYRYQERQKGRLTRLVPVAPDVDVDRVKAEMGDGLLELRFSKISQISTSRGRRIYVQPVKQ